MKIKFLSKEAKLPTRADEGAAGYDLYVPKDTLINPGRNVVPLDFSIELDHSYEAQIRPRSGFSLKGIEGTRYAKTNRFNADVIIGTIDETYRGNVGVLIYSHEYLQFTIPKGTRIAQMVIEKYYGKPLEVVDELSDTERGEGGFGHSGTK